MSLLAPIGAGRVHARFSSSPASPQLAPEGIVTISRDRSFDNEAFFAALDSAREARKLTWKQLASQAGVSASTLTRVGQGKRPDVDSFAALVAWAGLKPADFIGTSQGHSEPLAEIFGPFASRPSFERRGSDGATALDELLKATYKRLRKV
jgi:transcriptional regulator with XRE-family HTH domain